MRYNDQQHPDELQWQGQSILHPQDIADADARAREREQHELELQQAHVASYPPPLHKNEHAGARHSISETLSPYSDERPGDIETNKQAFRRGVVLDTANVESHQGTGWQPVLRDPRNLQGEGNFRLAI
jgi:hypothetical protein